MTTHRTVRVLVVNDHADTTRLLTRVLASEGYAVLAAASADEAADLARGGGCDLVVSDVAMPGRSGLDLMAELRAAHGLRGVALTGYADRRTRDAACDAGFERVLTKPLDLATLVQAVRDLTAAASNQSMSPGAIV